MDKKLNYFITQYSDRHDELNSLIVSAFVYNNDLDVKDGFLSSYLISDRHFVLDDENECLKSVSSIEDIINIFELAVPKNEQTKNGAVYTPKFIRDYIVHQVLKSVEKNIKNCLCADISCGCGAFLYTLSEYIQKKTGLTYSEIVPHLYGVDISSISIERAKILLSLSALLKGEILDVTKFRLYVGDSLIFDFMSLPNVKRNGGFDVVVGNPPYVRSKHIDSATKKNLLLWETARFGNSDLYIPFFELGLNLLNQHGQLGYITVNSFFKSVNARALRTFFVAKNISLSIIDFGQQLVFKKKLAYTCLVFMSKSFSDKLNYLKANVTEIKSFSPVSYNPIKYTSLDSHKGWNLNRMEVLENIYKIEHAGEMLGKQYIIKNGIATLANNIFIFQPVQVDDSFFYLRQEGKIYQIEKEICRDIIKPNIIKDEKDLNEKMEKIIFPYDSENNVFQESFFKTRFPFAYDYLKSHREVLDSRDKGKGNYPEWFAFGRTQALSDKGKKLLFPYMSDVPHFIYSSQNDLLIYCGYAIYNDSEQELMLLKKILESYVFEYYIKNTSKPYSTGYYSYAKNYVKSFGVCSLSQNEKNYLLTLSKKKDIDAFLIEQYGLDL